MSDKIFNRTSSPLATTPSLYQYDNATDREHSTMFVMPDARHHETNITDKDAAERYVRDYKCMSDAEWAAHKDDPENKALVQDWMKNGIPDDAAAERSIRGWYGIGNSDWKIYRNDPKVRDLVSRWKDSSGSVSFPAQLPLHGDDPTTAPDTEKKPAPAPTPAAPKKTPQPFTVADQKKVVDGLKACGYDTSTTSATIISLAQYKKDHGINSNAEVLKTMAK